MNGFSAQTRQTRKPETSDKTCVQTRCAQSHFEIIIIYGKTKPNLPHELRPKPGSTLGAGVPFLPSFLQF